MNLLPRQLTIARLLPGQTSWLFCSLFFSSVSGKPDHEVQGPAREFDYNPSVYKRPLGATALVLALQWLAALAGLGAALCYYFHLLFPYSLR